MAATTVTPDQCFNKYGEPGTNQANSHMIVWDVPDDINKEMLTSPNRIYCNKDLVQPLEKAFRNLIARGLHHELRTWDGCYNIRKQRGSYKSMSLHSWGIAVDMNAAWNGLGSKPTFTPGFVQCFVDAGFEWGGYWKRQDGMHFQLQKI
jgi:hypothetical protein